MSATLPLPAPARGPSNTTDIPAARLRRLTVDQYHRMIEIGVLGRDEPLELLDGFMLRQFDESSPFRGPDIALPSRDEWEHVVPLDRLCRITVDEYHRMIAAGILTEDDRVELLDGFLVDKMPRNSPHDGAITSLLELLSVVISRAWKLRCQNAVTLRNTEPEPDFAIVRADPGRYFDRHPNAADTAIVIEVSDSTLDFDLHYKLQRYAEEGIPEYWVVNIPDRQVEVFTQPAAAGYQSRQVFPVGAQVPVILDGRPVTQIDVADLFR